MRGFKLLLATGAVGLFMTGTSDRDRGSFQSIPRRGGPFQRGCGAGARRAATSGGGRVRPTAGVVRLERGPDRRARALLRAGSWLQLLRDTHRGDDVVRQGGGGEGHAGRPGARPAVRRRQPGRRAGGCRARTRGDQRPAGDRSERVAHGHRPVRRRGLSGSVARHRHAPARPVRRPQVRIPRAPRCLAVGHPTRIRRCRRTRRRRERSTADRDPARHVGRFGADVVPGHRRRPCSRGEPLPARRRRARSILVRGRHLPAGPRPGHRSRGAVHDVPRRQQRRDAGRHRGRCGRQRLRRRDHAVTRFPDDDRCVRPHGRRVELRRRVRHQAQSSGHGARVLDLRRRQRHGVRARHGARRIRQRVRHRPDEIVELPDHRQRVRPEPEHPGELPALRDRQHRQLRLQAQRRRLGAHVLDLSRRHRLRRRPRHRRRPIRQRLRGRRDPVGRLPHHVRRVRPDARWRVRHVRHQAQPHRLGARLLDVHRRYGGRQWRAVGRRQRRQRVRARVPRAPPTSRSPPARSTPRRTARSTQR